MCKSIKIAYLCWLFGGLFGLHHAYLKRDKHALIWFSTLGVFFVGFIVDAFKMRSYVNEANEEKDHIKQFNSIKKQIKVPAFYGYRFFGSILVGIFFSFITKFCFISENQALFALLQIVRSLIIALMVYLVGTEQPMHARYKWPFFGSLIGLLFEDVASIYGSPIMSTLFLNWNIEWDEELDLKKIKDRKLTTRIIIFIMYSGFLFCLISLFLWQTTVLNINGKNVLLKDAVYEFFDSKEMEKVYELINQVWNYYKAHGLRKLIYDKYYGYDPDQLVNAYKVNYYYF